ncbi:MAG TPA: hypothetical protein VF002_03140, partial [Gaiellaceae bacterium]
MEVAGERIPRHGLRILGIWAVACAIAIPIVPLGRPAAEALRRYLARGRPQLDRRRRPELFL